MGRGQKEDRRSLESMFGTTGGLSRQTRKYAQREEMAGGGDFEAATATSGGYKVGAVSRKATPPASVVDAHYKKYSGK